MMVGDVALNILAVPYNNLLQYQQLDCFTKWTETGNETLGFLNGIGY